MSHPHTTMCMAACATACCQVFDAPPLVKKALANTCGLHRTYCVAHDDTDVIKRLMEDHGVRNVYSTQVGVHTHSIDSRFLTVVPVSGNPAAGGCCSRQAGIDAWWVCGQKQDV
jgi:hypothetical protein